MTKIFCCQCEKEVEVLLKYGVDIQLNKHEFKDIPYWVCITCNNYVGCHKDIKLTPLGVIGTPEIRKKRQLIHSAINYILKQAKKKNKKIIIKNIYCYLSKKLGSPYHASNLRSVNDCENIINIMCDEKWPFLKVYNFFVDN